MSRVLLIFQFLSVVFTGEIPAQNFIGIHKDRIIQLMSEKHRNFKLNKDVINRTFNYLKYEDNISEQTILFFLNQDNYCTLVRWMSDYANINDIISKLNKEYTNAGKNCWTYSENDKSYVIRLEEGEWYFTVVFKLKS